MFTLLKHEFLRTRDMLALVAGVAVLLALAGTLLAATGVPILASVGLVAGLAAVFGLVPAAQLMLAVTYWRSSYGRTGYLTQTLPVQGSTIYWAKLLWAWLVSLVGAALSVGMVLAVDPACVDDVLSAYPGAWALGDVRTDDGAFGADEAYVQGAKGVDAGAAILVD